MSLKTKSNAARIGQALGKKASEFTFVDPPLIDAPFTQIQQLNGDPRQLPDPSKTLKPAMGIERIPVPSVISSNTLKGPNGERVFLQELNRDPRIAFYGDWRNASTSAGTRPIGEDDAVVEITFYGTGLNLGKHLFGPTAGIDIRATVDGGAESANIIPNSGNVANVLNSRNYKANQVVPVTSGLTLGVHTVKLRNATTTGVDFNLNFFEILNESAQIQVPEGEVWAAGNKLVNGALAALDYNTGFDNSPVLNGRGGRVRMYVTPEGRLGKAIQQADSAQGNLTGADHSNEAMIRRINFREFGANRTDDFSTLSTVRDAVFTLDDGTTTLIGNNVLVWAGTASGVGLAANAAGSFFTFTFVGTGLDIVSDAASTLGNNGVEVDGVNIGSISGSPGEGVLKIVSGLPYGTHTVKIALISGTGWALQDFIIYGPKQPDIPANAQEISEYYLMADFAANTTVGVETVSTGILRKSSSREMVYIEGAGAGTEPWAIVTSPEFYVGGVQLFTDELNAEVQYTFFGTGFDFRFEAGVGESSDIRVQINEVDLTDANFPTANFSTYGTGVTFNTSTGSLDQNNGTVQLGSGFVCSELPLGVYTVSFRLNSNDSLRMRADAIDIITPIHFPNTKAGSLSMGPGVQMQEETSTGGVDLSKAKAWCVFDGVNNEILSSHNISAVIDIQTGVYQFYFETPFLDGRYAAIATGNNFVLDLSSTASGNQTRSPNFCRINCRNSSFTLTDDDNVCIAFFGELADEGDES